MCYYYDGDGVCEDFERETGVRDCGLYTPSGFLDQWASSVEVSHEEKPYCSGEVAAGYPAVTKVRLLSCTVHVHKQNRLNYCDAEYCVDKVYVYFMEYLMHC